MPLPTLFPYTRTVADRQSAGADILGQAFRDLAAGLITQAELDAWSADVFQPWITGKALPTRYDTGKLAPDAPIGVTAIIRGLQPGQSVFLPISANYCGVAIQRAKKERPGAVFSTRAEANGRRVWCIADPFAD